MDKKGYPMPNENRKVFVYEILEIKPCGFESTIRDMEAERYKDK